MNYIGIDIGSTASKVAVKGDHDLHFVLPTGWSSKETCQTIKDRLLEDGIDVLSNDSKVVATGYGRVAVDFADHVITEITCHARGGREMAGDECAIIDVGGQDTKIILVSGGMVQDFQMNDKCSAGTGKFLEIMANRLGVTLQELFDMADKGTVLPISSLCTVFAESEVINYIGEGQIPSPLFIIKRQKRYVNLCIRKKNRTGLSEIINPVLHYFLLSFFLFLCKECGTKSTCISSMFGRRYCLSEFL